MRTAGECSGRALGRVVRQTGPTRKHLILFSFLHQLDSRLVESDEGIRIQIVTSLEGTIRTVVSVLREGGAHAVFLTGLAVRRRNNCLPGYEAVVEIGDGLGNFKQVRNIVDVYSVAYLYRVFAGDIPEENSVLRELREAKLQFNARLSAVAFDS